MKLGLRHQYYHRKIKQHRRNGAGRENTRKNWLLNTALRAGKQHCQKGTPEFLEHILTLIAQLAMKELVLFRFG